MTTTNGDLRRTFSELSTPLVADACLRLGLPLRIAPWGLRPVMPGSRVAGRARPVRHYGSVDIFLEAMAGADPGSVLVIDNEGRRDEGCIGDLTVLEARAWGMSGIVLWGTHRDTAELRGIDLPVFSYGSFPAGPRRLDAREQDALERAGFGEFSVDRQDVVFADDDGAIFVPEERVEQVLDIARTIRETERKQADDIAAGNKLYDQLHFREYLSRRANDPSYSFRQHLRALGGAIEE